MSLCSPPKMHQFTPGMSCGDHHRHPTGTRTISSYKRWSCLNYETDVKVKSYYDYVQDFTDSFMRRGAGNSFSLPCFVVALLAFVSSLDTSEAASVNEISAKRCKGFKLRCNSGSACGRVLSGHIWHRHVAPFPTVADQH